mmetsp:Transcript_41268/g.131216  ORF Transcript_41268/g.131216 Transcript_41268/m.131216 type:complete len:270 (+) Transcript_41268:349-1158(+)
MAEAARSLHASRGPGPGPDPAGEASGTHAEPSAVGEEPRGSTTPGPAGEASGCWPATLPARSKGSLRDDAAEACHAEGLWPAQPLAGLSWEAGPAGGSAACALRCVRRAAGCWFSLATSGRTTLWTDHVMPDGQRNKPGETPWRNANCCRDCVKSWKSESFVVEPKKYSASHRSALSAACAWPSQISAPPNLSNTAATSSGDVTTCASNRNAAADDAEVTGISPSAFRRMGTAVCDPIKVASNECWQRRNTAGTSTCSPQTRNTTVPLL